MNVLNISECTFYRLSHVCVSIAAEEASRQTQSALDTAADKASDTIKKFGHKLGTK
uniref:Si:ch211-59p23.1 n=1 Tax=Astyanax mexicanus TaxID=7994 RepID=A0A8B9GXU9_ASTMX